MKKSVLKNTLILVAISLSAALLLSVTYAVTKNKIAEAEEKERMDSFYTVMENAKEFLKKIAEDEALNARLAGKEPEEVLSAAKELDMECTKLCVKIYENSDEPGKENIRRFQDWLTKLYK